MGRRTVADFPWLSIPVNASGRGASRPRGLPGVPTSGCAGVARDRNGDADRHVEKDLGHALAQRIEAGRRGPAAGERVVKEEVDRVDARQVEALDPAEHDVTEVGLDALRREPIPQQRQPLRRGARSRRRWRGRPCRRCVPRPAGPAGPSPARCRRRAMAQASRRRDDVAASRRAAVQRDRDLAPLAVDREAGLARRPWAAATRAVAPAARRRAGRRRVRWCRATTRCRPARSRARTVRARAGRRGRRRRAASPRGCRACAHAARTRPRRRSPRRASRRSRRSRKHASSSRVRSRIAAPVRSALATASMPTMTSEPAAR